MSRQTYRKPVRIIDDGTTTNENRLGAVRDLLLAIEACSIDDDILVLAADNILDFSFRGFVEEFHAKGTVVEVSEEMAKILVDKGAATMGAKKTKTTEE